MRQDGAGGVGIALLLQKGRELFYICGEHVSLCVEARCAARAIEISLVHTYTLNSAHRVTFPTLSPIPSPSPSPNSPTRPITAPVKPPPTAPPMMLSPRIWSASSGKRSNNAATFVSGPVATSHGAPARSASSAARIASTASMSRRAGTRGAGRKVVPSRPVIPDDTVAVSVVGVGRQYMG